jgi:hypothetical protein
MCGNKKKTLSGGFSQLKFVIIKTNTEQCAPLYVFCKKQCCRRADVRTASSWIIFVEPQRDATKAPSL